MAAMSMRVSGRLTLAAHGHWFVNDTHRQHSLSHARIFTLIHTLTHSQHTRLQRVGGCGSSTFGRYQSVGGEGGGQVLCCAVSVRCLDWDCAGISWCISWCVSRAKHGNSNTTLATARAIEIAISIAVAIAIAIAITIPIA